MLRVQIIFFRVLFVLVNLKVTLCILNNFFGEFEHFCHLNTVTFLNFSFVDSVLKLEIVFIVNLACGVHVCDSFDFLLDFYHFVEMSCKETIRVDLSVKIFAQSPWESESFICASSSTKFINENQTFFCSSF